jgi:hypothetical protein
VGRKKGKKEGRKEIKKEDLIDTLSHELLMVLDKLSLKQSGLILV